ncbi:MAG: hypothetical protein ACLGH8_14740 [Bacteroidia bacterium]
MNWIALKALREIYETGSTRKRESLMKDHTIVHLLEQTSELKEGVDTINRGDGYDAYYRKYHLDNYSRYADFLSRTGLISPQLRFQESDIKVLMDLSERMENGDLSPIRDAIIEAEETVRGVSQMFFKNEKHLEKSSSLVRAVKQILDITELANEKDQQYLYILHCHAPKKIVLCENLDFLKRPTKPRKNNIELWYAGGKNINKLNFTGTVTLPIYYSCDWDYDGLLIYQMVKDILPQIQLLFPNAQSKSISETEHESHWDSSQEKELSGLDGRYFSESEKAMINMLITADHWIMEETNDLITMLG